MRKYAIGWPRYVCEEMEVGLVSRWVWGNAGKWKRLKKTGGIRDIRSFEMQGWSSPEFRIEDAAVWRAWGEGQGRQLQLRQPKLTMEANLFQVSRL